MDRPVTEMQGSVLEAIGADIDRVATACAADGWSGDADSVAVRVEAVEQAKQFVGMLDVTRFPLPDVVPEDDGDLALEWHRDDGHWVVTSFQPDGHVNYACRMGEGDKANGTGRISPQMARILEGYLAMVYAE